MQGNCSWQAEMLVVLLLMQHVGRGAAAGSTGGGGECANARTGDFTVETGSLFLAQVDEFCQFGDGERNHSFPLSGGKVGMGVVRLSNRSRSLNLATPTLAPPWKGEGTW